MGKLKEIYVSGESLESIQQIHDTHEQTMRNVTERQRTEWATLQETQATTRQEAMNTYRSG